MLMIFPLHLDTILYRSNNNQKRAAEGSEPIHRKIRGMPKYHPPRPRLLQHLIYISTHRFLGPIRPPSVPHRSITMIKRSLGRSVTCSKCHDLILSNVITAPNTRTCLVVSPVSSGSEGKEWVGHGTEAWQGGTGTERSCARERELRLHM